MDSMKDMAPLTLADVPIKAGRGLIVLAFATLPDPAFDLLLGNLQRLPLDASMVPGESWDALGRLQLAIVDYAANKKTRGSDSPAGQ